MSIVFGLPSQSVGEFRLKQQESLWEVWETRRLGGRRFPYLPQREKAARLLASGKMGLSRTHREEGRDAPPEPGVVLANDPCDGMERHVCGHGQDERFEQQREPAAGPAPRHIRRPHTAVGAVDPRNARSQNRLVLKEVQMTPLPLFGVVRLAFAS